MGFFAEFSTWLNAILATYIADNTARVAAAIEPAVITLAVLYTIIWGYLQLTGKIEEPFVTGLKRIFVLAIVLGVSLRLWLYNEVIVDTFFRVPVQLAGAVVGAFDVVGLVDGIMFAGDEAATLLFQRAGIFNGTMSYYIAGAALYLLVAVSVIYMIFLLALSRIALSVLLALGPVFIALLFFETTKRFFEAWIAQLSNYALVAVLTVLVISLMTRVVATAAEDALSAGGGISVSHAARVCLAAGLTLLVMRQVMPMAAGLASGLALSTFGVVSAGLRWASGSTLRHGGQFVRGFTDRQTTRWDSLSRKAGYYAQRGARALAGGWRENSIRAR